VRVALYRRLTVFPCSRSTAWLAWDVVNTRVYVCVVLKHRRWITYRVHSAYDNVSTSFLTVVQRCRHFCIFYQLLRDIYRAAWTVVCTYNDLSNFADMKISRGHLEQLPLPFCSFGPLKLCFSRWSLAVKRRMWVLEHMEFQQ